MAPASASPVGVGLQGVTKKGLVVGSLLVGAVSAVLGFSYYAHATVGLLTGNDFVPRDTLAFLLAKLPALPSPTGDWDSPGVMGATGFALFALGVFLMSVPWGIKRAVRVSLMLGALPLVMAWSWTVFTFDRGEMNMPITDFVGYLIRQYPFLGPGSNCPAAVYPGCLSTPYLNNWTALVGSVVSEGALGGYSLWRRLKP